MCIQEGVQLNYDTYKLKPKHYMPTENGNKTTLTYIRKPQFTYNKMSSSGPLSTSKCVHTHTHTYTHTHTHPHTKKESDRERFMFHAFALKALKVEVCLLSEKIPSMLPFFTVVKHRHALKPSTQNTAATVFP